LASFISVVKKVLGVAVTVEHDAAPLAETLFPQFAPEITAFDGLVTSLTGSIAKQENANPNGSGADKKAAVASDFATQLKPLNDLLVPTGYQVSFDQTALSEANDAFVLAYNKAAALKKSIAITKVTP
jgi:hypothetical protein